MNIKDVRFDNSLIKAGEDDLGVVWVGLRWLCEGIGLTEDRMKYERKKIQKDPVLRQGIKFYPLTGKSPVLCLSLDYVPLWLAKVTITPTMQKENPELSYKLTRYQFKAKDVLAAAFLGENQELIKLQNKIGTLTQIISDLTLKVDTLYKALEKPPKAQELPEESMLDWRERMYNLCDKLVSVSSKYTNRQEVIVDICEYMRKNYGIVWEQELREMSRRRPDKLRKMDIVYEKEMYRSIFESVLSDWSQEIDATFSAEKMIRPLIEKRNDNSPHGVITYRAVYKQMVVNYGVDWENYKKRYRSKLPTKPKNIDVVLVSSRLQVYFRCSVKDLLKEEKKG